MKVCKMTACSCAALWCSCFKESVQQFVGTVGLGALVSSGFSEENSGLSGRNVKLASALLPQKARGSANIHSWDARLHLSRGGTRQRRSRRGMWQHHSLSNRTPWRIMRVTDIWLYLRYLYINNDVCKHETDSWCRTRSIEFSCLPDWCTHKC